MLIKKKRNPLTACKLFRDSKKQELIASVLYSINSKAKLSSLKNASFVLEGTKNEL